MSARHVALFRARAHHAVMRAGTRASPAECPGAREQTRALASNCSSTVPRSAAPACARRGSATVMPPSCRVACVMTGLQNAKVLLGFSLDGMNNRTGTLITAAPAERTAPPAPRTTLLQFWGTRHYGSGARAHARISGTAGSSEKVRIAS